MAVPLPLDNNDRRALNTALSGMKVSLSHLNRLRLDGVLAGTDFCDRLASVVADVEEFKEQLTAGE